MNGRHAGPVSASRRRLLAVTLLAPTVAAGFVTMVPSVQAADLTCSLVPQLRDIAVSQGIGPSGTTAGYGVLIRGKSSVVKAYLSKPQCASTSDRIQIQSATLNVSFPGATSTAPLGNTITGPTFPELLAYAAAPAPAAAADPVFSVPGSYLDGTTSRDQRVDASFTMSVTYQATNSLGITTTGTTTLRPGTATSGPSTTAKFEKASNSLRLLVAVLGDPRKGYTANWPARTAPTLADGADDVLLKALQAASRLSPLKDGVVKDLNGTAGIRFAVAPTVVDVTQAIGADGKFCGNGNNYSYLRTQLSSFLNNWQSANSGTVVDKVLGVVWGPNSTGPGTTGACADGYATIGGGQAWTRLQPDTTSAPGNAGNLIVMETIGHNFGSVPQSRDNDGDAYHSAVAADSGTRGINTSTLQYIANAPSVLKYQLTGWNDYNTLLRREDWAYSRCRLTPATTESCPVDQVDLNANTTPIGAAADVKAAVYTIAGLTDGTSAGTDFDTYLAPLTDVSDPASATTTSYRLVQRGVSGASEPILSTTFFPVDFRTSEHLVEEGEGPSTRGSVEVRFEAAPGAEVFEVYKGDPATTSPIYRRKRDGAPIAGPGSLVPAIGTLTNQTEGTLAGGSDPALSADAAALAYSTPAGVVVKDLRTGARSAPAAGSGAAWVDSDTIVFVRDGNVVVADVALGAAPTIAAPSTVYDSYGTVPVVGAPAGPPTVSPDGGTVVTAIAGDLWQIDLEAALLAPSGLTCRLEATGLAPCRRLTTDAAVDSEPTYASATRLLFTRDGAVRSYDITGQVVEASSIAGASQAAASGAAAVYKSGGGLGLADAATLAVKRPILTTGADASPSLAGSRLAFARTAGGRTDVFTTSLSRNTLSFSATDTLPARLRANAFATCDGINYPIFADQEPSLVSGNVATWQLEWDGAGAPCLAPQLYVLINDGIDVVRVDLGSAIGPVSAPIGTVGAVYSPAPGQEVLQYDSVSLLGDVPGVTPNRLSWAVTGPGGFATSVSFTRGEATLLLPPSGGWVDQGVYAVRLLRDGAVLASGSYRAVADKDHDNIRATVEARCFGADADLDPTNASADPDTDGFANVSDSDPCTSAANVKVDLDANTLFGGSNGKSVTVYLTASKVDLRSIPLAGISVTSIGNYDADIHATALTNVTATSAVVKVPRADIQAFVAARNLGGYVPIVVSGTGLSARFRGLDLNDPIFT